MTPEKLYATLAIIAKHLNDNNKKFICVIAKGKNGRYDVFNGEEIDMDELIGAGNAIKKSMDNYLKKING